MAKLPSLQKIQDTIRGNIMAENMAKQSNGNKQPLHNAMAMVPESTMWRLITWLHEELLPKVLIHRGEGSIEYKNHVAIRDAVIWALYIGQQYEQLLAKVQRDRQLLGYYVEQNGKLEQELHRYIAIEQLITNDSVEMYRQSIVSKAIDILNQKTKQNEQRTG